ncbi:MAG: 4Fe-4S dicluster domain-containing protein [Candidatus Lokiarchaeota archaeon]|nr:4Fe-4S dicluster domain-containing protein [Candidatus Lokiarchaeota archaeon]
MSVKCAKCNTCTKNCPIIEITGKENLFEVFFGNEENIWNCSSCFTCEEVCPENLSVRDQIFRIRRSLELDDLQKGIKKYFKNLIETGNVFEIDEDYINERRSAMGLGEIDFKKIKSEIKKLMADFK